jgi:hypothetical protein
MNNGERWSDSGVMRASYDAKVFNGLIPAFCKHQIINCEQSSRPFDSKASHLQCKAIPTISQ